MFNSLREPMLRETRWANVLIIADALETAGVPYWLAGGWGVDALIAKQTRRHKDLDVVIERFEENEPKVRRTLLALGFHHVNIDTGGVWMPKRSNFEDAAGHRVEFLEIDWEYLGAALCVEHGLEAIPSRKGLAGEVFTTGKLNGRRVPCLTVAMQVLFHTGFSLDATGSADIARLQSELGNAT
ncbi:MAG TPA: hypothetical protein VMU64_01260 [Acidimicrobiales bacterium]|nr:hypothetical protein [Acidimicrobiales bacterium]